MVWYATVSGVAGLTSILVSRVRVHSRPRVLGEYEYDLLVYD